MSLKLDRRTALATLAATGLSPALAHAKGAAPSRFRHGVASGDPTADGIVLWTRLTTTAAREPVRWELARDAAFKDIVRRGKATADAAADHTVKVVVSGLEPGARYHYRFQAGSDVSVVGRTRTLPRGRLDKLGVALVSCSNFAFGWFNAYAAIAKDPAVDIVLHTGDYIYEYGATQWGGDVGKTIGRVHEPAGETVTLADYRRRHAQYKSDPGSQAMHAAHPFVACWDDHEVTNNPWIGGAQNHQANEGDWATRRAVALQAYYEWMPIRDPGPAPGAREAFWRSYAFGDLATLVTMESRHTGRDQQVSYADHFDKIKTKADRDAFMRDVIGDPNRRMLSSAMEADLEASFASSVSARQPWRLLGSASPIARMLVPDLSALGIDPTRNRGYDPKAPATPDLMWTATWNLPFYTDTWDGYPAARERLYAACARAGARDLLVLTGDSHSFWMNELFDAAGQRMGLEVGTAGVTSPGDFVETGWDEDTARRLDRAFETLDEVVWTDNFHQGYVRVELTPEAARATAVAVRTVLTQDDRTFDLRSTQIVRKDGTLVYA